MRKQCRCELVQPIAAWTMRSSLPRCTAPGTSRRRHTTGSTLLNCARTWRALWLAGRATPED